jgi:hypothetical protein
MGGHRTFILSQKRGRKCTNADRKGIPGRNYDTDGTYGR